MSYDVVLVARRDGQSWEHALDEVERRADSDQTLDDRRLAQWTAIERRLRERAGDIDVFADASVVEASFTVGLQVSLFADEASVSYPYWEQEDPDAFRALVVDAVRIVEEETGFEAWDPQTGQAFDGTLDDETGLAAVRKMNAEGGVTSTFGGDDEPAIAGEPAVGGEPTVPAVGGSALAATQREDRRRAKRYLAVGAIVLPLALLVLLMGEPGPLTVLGLAIGVVDLAVGAYLWRRSRAGSDGR